MKYEKSCGCIVFNEKKQILLVHQNAGHWGMPKGHVENDETEIQTAKREVKEETNLDVEFRNDRNNINKEVEAAKKERNEANNKIKNLEWSSGKRDKIKIENEIRKIDKILGYRLV